VVKENGMTIEELDVKLPTMLDSLSLRNRAYQVLYVLGDTPGDVRTLTDGEAACLVGIVQDMLETDEEWSGLQVVIGSAMSMRMLEYVASGSTR
jgi:hypothetical protein